MGLDGISKVVRGTAMYHRVQILDTRKRPARPYDPDAGAGAGINSVRVSYYRPDKTVHPNVNNVVMTRVAGVVGEYEFTYQCANDDPLGVWEVEVRSTHQGFVSKEPRQVRFEVVLA